MASSKKINIAELDFDGIKDNLKSYLSSQPQFDGYDFEGSGLNILLDVLAYNTHYNSFYLNMIANEMFFDSSSLRQSVVSHAKLLGYTPRSTTAATAKVNITITKNVSDPTTSLTLPRFSTLTSQALDGQSYQFITVDETTVSADGNVFLFENVEIKEGTSVSYVFPLVSAVNPKQIFTLPDENIDTTTLLVTVQKSATESRLQKFSLAQDATEVTGQSNVFYLEEGDKGLYRIYFGDDVFGKKLEDGNLVIVSYLVTEGVAANGISKFKLSTNPLAGSTSSVETLVKSAAGSVRELVEDIKFTAPRAVISNNRAVTKNDYIALINKRYPFFDSINVWGGEEESPPVYGKVFITAKPKLGFEVSEREKQLLKDEIIKPISVLTVTPEFIDANFNFVNIHAKVIYDTNSTNRTAAGIRDAVVQSIKEFSIDTLNSFDSTFQLSTLLRTIDETDTAIVSSVSEVTLEKRLSPIFSTTQNYVVRFDVPLRRGSTSVDRIYSSPAYLQTDSQGVQRSVFLEETPDSFSGVESIEILDPGVNYTSTPTVNIVGDGDGAQARAVVVNGRIKRIEVTNPGIGYTTARITFTNRPNDLGRGAAAKAVIRGRRGVLRSYFFDSTGVKRILNANAGVIEYDLGTITLSNFSPEDIVDTGDKILKIYAKPLTKEFSSNKSTILVLDRSDPSAIKVEVRATKI